MVKNTNNTEENETDSTSTKNQLESWLSEVLQFKMTFNPSIYIFQDTAYEGVVRYPMDWTIHFSSTILKAK